MSDTTAQRAAALVQQNAELRAELKYRHKHESYKALTTISGQFFRALAIAVPFLCIAYAAHEFAGRTTKADVRGSISVSVESESVAESLEKVLGEAWLSASLAVIGGGGILYGLGQRRLRKKQLGDYLPYRRRYEALIEELKNRGFVLPIVDPNYDEGD